MANYLVLKNKEGVWAVRRVGGMKARYRYDLKKEAEKFAKKIVASSGGGVVLIHDRDGRLINSYTLGSKKARVN